MINFNAKRNIFGMRNMGANMGQVNDPTPIDYSDPSNFLRGVSASNGLLGFQNAIAQEKYNNAPNMSRGTPQPWDYTYGGPTMRPSLPGFVEGLQTMTPLTPEQERYQQKALTHGLGLVGSRGDEGGDEGGDEMGDEWGRRNATQSILKGLLEAYT
jgi:hypothetical protein